MANNRNGKKKTGRRMGGPARERMGLRQEMAGIFLLAVALYFGVSLYSNDYASNWGGVIGLYLSGTLVFAIGYLSYAFPFLLAIISFELLLRRIFRFRPVVPVCFAFFIVFRERPGTNRLNVPRTKSGPAVRIEHVATSRFIEHAPNLQPFTQLPTTAVQHGATSAKLCGLTLVPGPLGEIVKCLLTRHF